MVFPALIFLTVKSPIFRSKWSRKLYEHNIQPFLGSHHKGCIVKVFIQHGKVVLDSNVMQIYEFVIDGEQVLQTQCSLYNLIHKDTV